MADLNWLPTSKDRYFGTDRGVLYFSNNEFVPWNGLVSVTEKLDDTEIKQRYFDGMCFSLTEGVSDFALDVEAFTFPYLLEDHILALCDTRVYSGARTDYEPFQMTYRVMKQDGYLIHLVFGLVAVFEGYDYQSINANPDVEPFSFKFYATPVKVPNANPAAHFSVDTSKADPALVSRLEDILYGSGTTTPRFPSIEDLTGIFANDLARR